MFDLTPEELRQLGAGVLDLMQAAIEDEKQDPILPSASGSELADRFTGPAPRTGTPPLQLLDEVRRDLIPANRRNGHPRFFGYVCASADPVATYFDALAGALNQNVTAWRSAPGATAMEHLVVSWIDELVGFEGGGQGLLVGGGSAANATGVACALRASAERDGQELADVLGRLVVYRSPELHLSLAKALRVFGLPDRNVRMVSTDAERALDPVDLQRKIAEDRAAGLLPACVCASAGTANTGAVDPLDAIADITQAEGLWLHVDGAYGAPAAMTPHYAHLRAGFARADSLSIDPHKWLFVTIDAGCILLRDARRARAAFTEDSEYTMVLGSDPVERFAFFDHGLEMSRRHRALKVWAVLKSRGADALAAAIGANIDLRRHLEARIAADERLEALGSGMSIACFRWRPEGSSEPQVETWNLTILQALNDSGHFFLSPTTVDGRFALRVCIVNFRTRREDIDALVDAVLALGEGLE